VSEFVKSRFIMTKGSPDKGAAKDFREVDFAAQARSVLDQAIQRGAMIERKAYEDGFAKGEQAGIQLGKQQMMPVLERLESMLKELAGARERMLREMEPKIVSLALTIAEQVIHKSIAADGTIVLETVKAAVSESVDRGKIIVRVSPSDHQTVVELRPDLMKMKDVEEVEVISDPDVKPGGCVIRTQNGLIDAQVETGIKEIRTLAE
jgi:flagellar assembly protein FliH